MTTQNIIDRLNKRITIQEKTITKDGFGGYQESWSNVKTLWAEIKPISNLDSFEANKIEEKITYIITIRYFESLTTLNRIKYDNRIFNIVGIINPLENNQTMQIEAEEIL